MYRAFEKKMRRGIFGPKADEVTAGRRKLQQNELHNLYSSRIIRVITSRRIRWMRHAARTEQIRTAYNILVGKTELIKWYALA
jgi:hypothetical protein